MIVQLLHYLVANHIKPRGASLRSNMAFESCVCNTQHGPRDRSITNACGETTVFHLQKRWTKRRSRGPRQKYHQMKANFIDNNDIFFSKRKKIATYLIFPSVWRLVV